MTRNLTINPAVISLAPLKADHYIKYENNEGRPTLSSECAVLFIFPGSLESITVDAARLRENSAFIDECIKKPWFDACGRRICMLHVTATEFRRYMSWVKWLKFSRRKLRLPPANIAPSSKAYLKKHQDCLVMDNLVHWWLLGDAMQDNNLKATAMKLLHQYGPQGYEIPLQTLVRAWVKCEVDSELRRFILLALKQTMKKSTFQQRGKYMPADLVAKLFVWFLGDVASNTPPLSPQMGHRSEAASARQ